MSTTRTQIVKFIRKGEKGDPAINIVVTGENVVFTDINQVAYVYVNVYIGEERIKYGDGSNNTFACGVLSTTSGKTLFDGKGAWNFRTEDNGYRFVYMLYILEKFSISEDVPFTVIVNGTNYSKKISVKSVFDGAVLRGPQAWSDCEVGYSFQAGGAGDEYKDVVLYNDNYYSCVKSHTKTADNYPGSTTANNNGYWRLGDKIELVAAKILLATYALVENLGVTAIEMKDSSGNILFQAKDGNVICKTGTFENIKVIGSLRNPFTYATDSIDNDYNDNVVMISNGGGWVDAFSLPWDVGQSGRRVTIVNYRWGSSYAQGQASISAPTSSGKYFYENGISKDSLNLSREAVELLGYGTATQFYGWIVMRRIDMMTTYKYGKELKILGFGSVTEDGGISYDTFDGNSLSCVRDGTGQYTITMPSGWFSNATNVGVILTGVGHIKGSTTSPIKATLISRTTTQIVVETSDDNSVNDGAFDFIIFNKNDWQTL